MNRNRIPFWLAFGVLLWLGGCSGIRFTQVPAELKDFHPRGVAALPVSTGIFKDAAGTADALLEQCLRERRGLARVVAGATYAKTLADHPDLAKMIRDYQAKLETLNFSDPELSRLIGEQLQVEALLVVWVEDYSYSVVAGQKRAKVAIGMKLIETASGRQAWLASHALNEEYSIFKPTLDDMAKKVMAKMLDVMPQ
jgi:hypothetical protein